MALPRSPSPSFVRLLCVKVHTQGLGENPPTGRSLDSRQLQVCWHEPPATLLNAQVCIRESGAEDPTSFSPRVRSSMKQVLRCLQLNTLLAVLIPWKCCNELLKLISAILESVLIWLDLLPRPRLILDNERVKPVTLNSPFEFLCVCEVFFGVIISRSI